MIGRSEFATPAAGPISDSYDDLDRLSSETTSEGSLSYGYDAADRHTLMTG